MGPHFGPILANIFVGFHEESLLLDLNKPDIYFRSIDDTFCLFNNENEENLFNTSLSNSYPTLKFTLVKETNSSFPSCL